MFFFISLPFRAIMREWRSYVNLLEKSSAAS